MRAGVRTPDGVWALVIGAFAALNAADLGLTLESLARGATELNPVMAALLDGGAAAAIAFKAAVTVGVALGLWVGRGHRVVRSAGVGFVALMIAVVGYQVVNLSLA